MNEQPFNLTGQHILITGGGSGLGLGMAGAMAASGGRITIVGRDQQKLRDAVRELGGAATYRVCDVSDLSAIPDLVEDVECSIGPLHTLVNNAGNHLKKPAMETADAEFQSLIQTHVNAAFALSRECGKRMQRRGQGHILFIASMASLFGIPLVAAYSAAKTAQLGLVRALAAELSPKGVRVNAIAPGWIRSDMMRTALEKDPARKAKILSRTPVDDFGHAEDIGWAAVYLSSPAANFVTGVCLPIDGGASIGF